MLIFQMKNLDIEEKEEVVGDEQTNIGIFD
jgi:hypothetical protein